MAGHFDILFRGDIKPGENVADVKQRVAALFKQDPQKINHLFSGKVQYLKRAVDQTTAEKYKTALHKAGAIVQIKPAEESGISVSPAPEKAEPKPHAGSESSATDKQAAPASSSGSESFSIAPVGADVLKKEERKKADTLDVKTDHLSLAPVGADLLKESERKRETATSPDTSHISLQNNK